MTIARTYVQVFQLLNALALQVEYLIQLGGAGVPVVEGGHRWVARGGERGRHYRVVEVVVVDGAMVMRVSSQAHSHLGPGVLSSPSSPPTHGSGVQPPTHSSRVQPSHSQQ